MDHGTLHLGTKIVSSELMLKGFQAFRHKGEIVWVGRIGEPIEDIVCDEMIFSPFDYYRLLAFLDKGPK